MMAKQLPKDEPNRRTSSLGPKPSRVDKRSKVDGTIPVGQDLAPDQGRRVSKEPIFGPSAPMSTGKVRDDSSLGRFDSTRTTAEAGPRNWVRRDEGQDQVERIGDNVEGLGQTDVPDALD